MDNYRLSSDVTDTAMVVFSLPVKNRKGCLATNVFVAFAIHSGHLQDVIDTDRWANDYTRGGFIETFEPRFRTRREIEQKT